MFLVLVRTVDPIRRGLRPYLKTFRAVSAVSVRTVDPIRRGLRQNQKIWTIYFRFCENR